MLLRFRRHLWQGVYGLMYDQAFGFVYGTAYKHFPRSPQASPLVSRSAVSGPPLDQSPRWVVAPGRPAGTPRDAWPTHREGDRDQDVPYLLRSSTTRLRM